MDKPKGQKKITLTMEELNKIAELYYMSGYYACLDGDTSCLDNGTYPSDDTFVSGPINGRQMFCDFEVEDIN